MTENKAYYGITFKVGDTVTFPAGADMMDGVVEKFRGDPRYPNNNQCFVKNGAGYKKWKKCINVIARSVIKNSAPDLFI